MLELIGYVLVFLISESIIDGQTSRNYTDLFLIAKQEKLRELKDLFSDRRFYTKIVKFIVIPIALYFYSEAKGNYDFAKAYVILRVIGFDFLLSLNRFNKAKPFMWYIKNHITVRTYQFIARLFK